MRSSLSRPSGGSCCLARSTAPAPVITVRPCSGPSVCASSLLRRFIRLVCKASTISQQRVNEPPDALYGVMRAQTRLKMIMAEMAEVDAALEDACEAIYNATPYPSGERDAEAVAS